MITRNPMQLKALVKNLAKEKGISAQLVIKYCEDFPYAKGIEFAQVCASIREVKHE